MVREDMPDSGGGGEAEGGECLIRCKLSPLAQSTLRSVFDGIVSDFYYSVNSLSLFLYLTQISNSYLRMFSS